MPYSLGNFPVTARGGTVGSVTVSQSGLMTVFNCTCRCKSREILRLAAVCGGRYVTLGVPVPDNVAAASPDPAAAPASEAGALCLKKSFSKKALGDLGYDSPLAFHLIRSEEVFAPPHDTGDGGSQETDMMPEASAEEQDWTENLPVRPEEFEAPRMGLNSLPEQMTPEAVEEDLTAVCPAMPAEDGLEEAADLDGWTQITTPGYIFSEPSVAEACDGITGALLAVREDHLLLAVPVSPEEPFPLMAVFCFGSSDLIGGREYIVFKVRDGNLIL